MVSPELQVPTDAQNDPVAIYAPQLSQGGTLEVLRGDRSFSNETKGAGYAASLVLDGAVVAYFRNADDADKVAKQWNATVDLLAALELVSRQQGLEPSEPYGVAVLNAIAKAR